MLRDLNIVRNKLHAKKYETPNEVTIDEVVEVDDMKDRLIEWLQDDLSETESDILAHSKKKERCLKES